MCGSLCWMTNSQSYDEILVLFSSARSEVFDFFEHVKPFDDNLLLDSLLKVKAIISVEEHSESGGLGEKGASIISQHNIKIPFKIIGFPDEYKINGSQSDVVDHYNMSPEKLANIAENLIK